MVAVFSLVSLVLAASAAAAPNRQQKRSDGAPRLMIRPVAGSGCPPGTFACGDKWCAPQRGQCCDWGACATGWACSGEDTCCEYPCMRRCRVGSRCCPIVLPVLLPSCASRTVVAAGSPDRVSREALPGIARKTAGIGTAPRPRPRPRPRDARETPARRKR